MNTEQWKEMWHVRDRQKFRWLLSREEMLQSASSTAAQQNFSFIRMHFERDLLYSSARGPGPQVGHTASVPKARLDRESWGFSSSRERGFTRHGSLLQESSACALLCMVLVALGFRTTTVSVHFAYDCVRCCWRKCFGCIALNSSLSLTSLGSSAACDGWPLNKSFVGLGYSSCCDGYKLGSHWASCVSHM